MRKQTKLVAVLSAAALLALGASMTSFAAGWEKDDAGVWHYYDEDDELVTGEWKKDGGKWFYLDDDGDMLTNDWVDSEYYVGEDGAMLVNSWLKTYADEDVEDPDEDDEYWFYFGSKGKITTEDKKINGKTYYFDSEGRMYDEWYSPDGKTVYYLGDEDDGARKSGWLWLEKPEDEDGLACNDGCEDCDDEGWYWFGSSGKMYKDVAKKKINGKWYYFNEHGQMLYEWINTNTVSKKGSNAQLDGDKKIGSPAIAEMIYTNAVEEGWRADGWYEIDGSEDTKTDSDTDWYYFDDGKAERADSDSDKDYVGVDEDGVDIYRARIKVEGKYFCFNEYGQMQTGLQYIPAQDAFYYFDENGYQKTGKIANVEDDDDSYTFYFNTKNGKNGQGVNGEKDGYLYWNGQRLEADDDYRIYNVGSEYYLVNTKGKIQKSASKEYDVELASGDTVEEIKFEFKNNDAISKVTKGTIDYKAEASYGKIVLDGNSYSNAPVIEDTTTDGEE